MMEIITCEQGTPEWYAARLGIPTASMFATVMAKGEGKTRRTYLNKLAGEILTGEPMDNFSNGHMDRGKVMEGEARDLYALLTDTSPECVGFIRNGRKGCSPDSMVGKNGLVEIKTQLPHLMVETLLADRFPAQHVAQCQGQIWSAEREWVDIAIYWPKFPLFTKRAYRDEPYIKNMADEVDRFLEELDATVAKVRAYGTVPA